MKCGVRIWGDTCYKDAGHPGNIHFSWDWYGSNPMRLGGRVFSNESPDGYEGSWEYDFKDWPKEVIWNILEDWNNMTPGFQADFVEKVEKEGDDETRAHVRRCSFSPGVQ